MNLSLTLGQLNQSPFPEPPTATPLCPVFGECGGCRYQHLSYPDEIRIKDARVREILAPVLTAGTAWESMAPSPRDYRYRNRLDLSLLRTKDGQIRIGFKPEGRFRVLEIEDCFIAQASIGDFLPALRAEVAAMIPPDYRIASLVVKTGEDGRVRWGGIGKRSLRMPVEDAFGITVRGHKIRYSLETFFQANPYILPELFETLDRWGAAGEVLLDLYAGVGLFGLALEKAFKKIVLVEENAASMKLARLNVDQAAARHIEIRPGRVEEILPVLKQECAGMPVTAIVDPPRAGLSSAAAEALAGAGWVQKLFYLSCHPDSLARDLAFFNGNGWRVSRVRAFDFFPKTRHIETLAMLERAAA